MIAVGAPPLHMLCPLTTLMCLRIAGIATLNTLTGNEISTGIKGHFSQTGQEIQYEAKITCLMAEIRACKTRVGAWRAPGGPCIPVSVLFFRQSYDCVLCRNLPAKHDLQKVHCCMYIFMHAYTSDIADSCSTLCCVMFPAAVSAALIQRPFCGYSDSFKCTVCHANIETLKQASMFAAARRQPPSGEPGSSQHYSRPAAPSEPTGQPGSGEFDVRLLFNMLSGSMAAPPSFAPVTDDSNQHKRKHEQMQVKFGFRLPLLEPKFHAVIDEKSCEETHT